MDIFMVEKKTEKKTQKKLSAKEIEELVLKLVEKDTPIAKIGLILKEEHDVPKAKYTTGKIHKILEKNKISRFPDELQDLIKRATKLRGHLKKNHKDQTAKRGLNLTEAKLRKIASYLKKKGKLDKKWTYTPK